MQLMKKITRLLVLFFFFYPGGIPGSTGGIPGIIGGTLGIIGGIPKTKRSIFTSCVLPHKKIVHVIYIGYLLTLIFLF